MLNFTTRSCDLGDGLVTKFKPPIINATFYQDCIEDSEVINFNMKLEVFFSTNTSLLHEEVTGESFYILQNGSLLIVYDTMNTGYTFTRNTVWTMIQSQTSFMPSCGKRMCRKNSSQDSFSCPVSTEESPPSRSSASVACSSPLRCI